MVLITMSLDARCSIPAKTCYDLQDYRMRYAQYKLDEDLQFAHQNTPWIVIWDDHEFTDNTWRDGANGNDPRNLLVVKIIR